MARRALLAFATVMLLALPASAQKRPELGGPTQREINAQAADRHRIADAELNAAYQQLMSASTLSGRARLRAAQRAWMTFRDLDCEARAGSRGGSFHPAAVSLCLEQLADERTRQLHRELECDGADMVCGGHFSN